MRNISLNRVRIIYFDVVSKVSRKDKRNVHYESIKVTIRRKKQILRRKQSKLTKVLSNYLYRVLNFIEYDLLTYQTIWKIKNFWQESVKLPTSVDKLFNKFLNDLSLILEHTRKKKKSRWQTIKGVTVLYYYSKEENKRVGVSFKRRRYDGKGKRS